MSSPTIVLSKYAHTLQLAAPREWEAFVACFDAYVQEVTVAVTFAEQNEVLAAQGRAQAFRHLADVFKGKLTPSIAPKTP